MGDFQNQSVIAERNVDGSGAQLSSFLEENAVNQTNLGNIFHQIFTEFKRLNGHHKFGETRRQELTNQIEQLSKVILERMMDVGGK